MTESKCAENNHVIKDMEGMNTMDETLLDEEGTHEDFQGATLQIHNDTYYLNSRSPSPKADASKTAINMQVAASSVPLNGDENARDFFSFRSGLVDSAIEECIKSIVFPEKDGEVIGCWLLTEISFWDAEKERLVILTTHTLITVKYDFIALRQLDHRAVPLRVIDTLVIGDLVYPSASLVPRMNGLASGVLTVVKGCLLRPLQQKWSKEKSPNDCHLSNNSSSPYDLISSFEPRSRNTKGVRALWNRGAPISFGRRWNPFNSDIPFVTYTFHPLYWARQKQKEPQKSGNEDWGYVQVRPGANMFWWLYKTTAVKSPEAASSRPLVIWLQGGPGASSTGYGNFLEIGPLDAYLKPRNTTWVNDVNVLFLDNPVGTGYSYVTSSSLLTTTNAEIASDLVEFMRSFLNDKPEWQDVPLYIFSESYGGKMAAEFGLGLYKAKTSGALNVNIKGVALGDSWISPIDSVMTWAPFLLQTAMVDQNGFEAIDTYAQSTKRAVESGQWVSATNMWGSTENEVLYVTDGVDFYNILTKIPSGSRERKARELRTTEDIKRFLFERHVRIAGDEVLDEIMNGVIKQKLGIIPSNVRWGGQSGQVFSALYEDFMRPVTSVVETLLDETDLTVAVLSGQLDLIVDTPGTVNWVDRLQWSGSSQWQNTGRDTLVSNGYIEGFTKKYNSLSMYWILRAGHMVPADNPDGANELLRQITKFA